MADPVPVSLTEGAPLPGRVAALARRLNLRRGGGIGRAEPCVACHCAPLLGRQQHTAECPNR